MKKVSEKKDAVVMKQIESELSTFLKVLEEKYLVSSKDIIELLRKEPDKDVIPVCIFKERKLSGLEVITKFMKENLGLKYSGIASDMNRNSGTIGITYRNARKKMSGGLIITSGIDIPILIFKDRKLSVLENIVVYLRKNGMSLHEIAVLINRDDRTIWTVNNRANLKLKK